MSDDAPWDDSLDAVQGTLEAVAPNVWWVWSLMASLPLGPVEVVVVPSGGHRMDAGRFRARYPEATFVCPANAREQVEQVVAVDGTCEDVLPDKGVRIHRPDGMKDGYELVYEVDLGDGGIGLLVNDILAEPHPHQPGGIKGFLMGLLGPKGGKLGQPIRAPRQALRDAAERL